MKLRHKKTSKKIPYVDLRTLQGDLSSYQEELENIFDRKRQQCSEHSRDYEELTMEEKLLVDADIKYLLNEEYLHNDSLLFWNGMDKYTLEKNLARLRKRDRENDKRNRK